MFRGSWDRLLSRCCHVNVTLFCDKSLGISPHPLFTLKCDGSKMVSFFTPQQQQQFLGPALRFKDLIVVLTLSHYITHLISAPSRTMITMVSVHKSVSWRGSMNRRKCCPLEMLIILLGFITNTALAKVVVVKRPHLPPGWTKHFRFPIGKYLPQWNIAQVFYQ